MFQGSPRRPCATVPASRTSPLSLDAVLLTHAHLDHCGLLPAAREAGLPRPDPSPRAAPPSWPRLVMLDSGKLQVEQAQAHKERLRAARRAARRSAAAGGTEPRLVHGGGRPGDRAVPGAPSRAAGAIPSGRDPERCAPPAGSDRDGASSRPSTTPTTRAALECFQWSRLRHGLDVAPGVRAMFHDAGPHPGLGDHRGRGCRPRRTATPHRLLGRPGPARHAHPARPDRHPRRSRLRPVRVHLRGPRARARGEAVRLLAEAIQATADHSGVLLVPPSPSAARRR